MKTKHSITDIKTMTFDSTDMPELSAKDSHSASYRMTAAQLAGMPKDNRDIAALRRRISELFNEKLNNNYAKLESNCDIKRDTFQKMLKFRNGRNITYTQLAKFCVGAKISETESRELFSLMGYELNGRNLCDYVLICELQTGSDISDYDKDMIEHYGKSILSQEKADKLP